MNCEVILLQIPEMVRIDCLLRDKNKVRFRFNYTSLAGMMSKKALFTYLNPFMHRIIIIPVQTVFIPCVCG